MKNILIYTFIVLPSLGKDLKCFTRGSKLHRRPKKLER